jgi:hypothetical protein
MLRVNWVPCHHDLQRSRITDGEVDIQRRTATGRIRLRIQEDQIRAGKPFGERGPKLLLILREIHSRAHRNFQQQNGGLESFIIIINCYYTV